MIWPDMKHTPIRKLDGGNVGIPSYEEGWNAAIQSCQEAYASFQHSDTIVGWHIETSGYSTEKNELEFEDNFPPSSWCDCCGVNSIHDGQVNMKPLYKKWYCFSCYPKMVEVKLAEDKLSRPTAKSDLCQHDWLASTNWNFEFCKKCFERRKIAKSDNGQLDDDKYIKKPIPIEANKFIPLFDPFEPEQCFLGFKILQDKQGFYLTIPTPEGNHRADAGDWIAKGYSSKLGFHYWPIKPDYFEENYIKFTTQPNNPKAQQSTEETMRSMDDYAAGFRDGKAQSGLVPLDRIELIKLVLTQISIDANQVHIVGIQYLENQRLKRAELLSDLIIGKFGTKPNNPKAETGLVEKCACMNGEIMGDCPEHGTDTISYGQMVISMAKVFHNETCDCNLPIENLVTHNLSGDDYIKGIEAVVKKFGTQSQRKLTKAEIEQAIRTANAKYTDMYGDIKRPNKYKVTLQADAVYDLMAELTAQRNVSVEEIDKILFNQGFKLTNLRGICAKAVHSHIYGTKGEV